MCYCTTTVDDKPVFKAALYSGHHDKDVIHTAFGEMIISASNNFTTVLMPIVVDGELVYGITSYGSNELILVRDDDDYPLFEYSEKTQPLPIGLRKAAALETAIHLENVRKYNLENVDPNTKRYFPATPRDIYDLRLDARKRSIRRKKLSETRLGRLYLRIFDV